MRGRTYEDVSKTDRRKMMRKNIFEIVKSQQQPLLEISRINELLNKQNGVYIKNDPFAFDRGIPTSAIKYIDDNLFMSWKQRGTCINCSDFQLTLGISTIPDTEDKLTNEFIIIYCEYAANMLYLLRQKIAKSDELTDIIPAAEENIKKFLVWYNYKLKYFSKEQKVLVVPNNPYVTSVAESIENEDLSYSIIEYNHYLLKGDIVRKKAILVSLGSDLEPHRPKISSINKKLEDSIFFMLNNLDLRHNNRTKGDKKYNEKVANMNKAKLEKWYDELYQLMLTAYICMENIKRLDAVDKLKKEII